MAPAAAVMTASLARAPAGIGAVLFDWGDTLFAPPDAGQVIVNIARERGLAIDAEVARTIWEELWAAGKSADDQGPQPLARGSSGGLDVTVPSS